MTDTPNNEGSGFKAFWWVMGVISLLLSAGVIGAIATYSQVGRLDTNVTLLRAEVASQESRQYDQVQALEQRMNDRMRSLESKFDSYVSRRDDNR